MQEPVRSIKTAYMQAYNTWLFETKVMLALLATQRYYRSLECNSVEVALRHTCYCLTVRSNTGHDTFSIFCFYWIEIHRGCSIQGWKRSPGLTSHCGDPCIHI